MTKTTGSTNPVQICFAKLWKIEVDNYIHSRYVNSTGEEISTHEISAAAILKVVENTIPVWL